MLGDKYIVGRCSCVTKTWGLEMTETTEEGMGLGKQVGKKNCGSERKE